MADYTMKCGCVVEVTIYNTACCSYCNDYYDVDEVCFISNCEEHSADADPA